MVKKRCIISKAILIILLVIFIANFLFNIGLHFWLLAAMVIGAAIYHNALVKKMKRLDMQAKEELEAREFEGPSKERDCLSKEQDEGYAELMRYTSKLKRKIQKKMRKVNSLKEKLGSDMLNVLLDDYLKGIMKMIGRSEELKSLMEAFSVKNVQGEIYRLKKRLAKTEDRGLKTEYRNTIKRYVKHLESYDELSAQKERLGLRIRQAVVSLEEYHINCTRVKEVIDSEDDYVLKEFQRQGEELSRYLDNLNASYLELDREF